MEKVRVKLEINLQDSIQPKKDLMNWVKFKGFPWSFNYIKRVMLNNSYAINILKTFSVSVNVKSFNILKYISNY